MRHQRQLNDHDPDNGVYGDCYRTCIAAVLDMDAAEVPHFCDGDKSPDQAYRDIQAWLAEQGLYLIRMVFNGTEPLPDVLCSGRILNPGLHYLLGGTSARGCGHSVVCLDDQIVMDPSGSGIVGPLGDYYWIEFIGRKV